MTHDCNQDDMAGSLHPAGSAIPAIQSSVLNIGTAMSDCESAREAWIEGNWNDATMWISNAISQLESAKAKIYAHQETESPNDEMRDAMGGKDHE